MHNISDMIEEFILSTMAENDSLDFSRNDLAEYFRCAPSQINYVLTTRFNINRGFVITSQRGGGGYITISKFEPSSDYMMELVSDRLNNPISYKDSVYLLNELTSRGFLKDEVAQALTLAISHDSLSMPIRLEDELRAKILKNTFVGMLKNGGNQ